MQPTPELAPAPEPAIIDWQEMNLDVHLSGLQGEAFIPPWIKDSDNGKAALNNGWQGFVPMVIEQHPLGYRAGHYDRLEGQLIPDSYQPLKTPLFPTIGQAQSAMGEWVKATNECDSEDKFHLLEYNQNTGKWELPSSR